MEKLSQREKRGNPLISSGNQGSLIVLLGPTASGKSALAVLLAKKYRGEIVSADSRQIYKGLDIGTGKITKREMAGIPHHLLDIASLARTFTVAQYQKKALEAIRSIQEKNKIPFLVGGSPLYIYATTDGLVFPNVKPNPALRKKLARLSARELFQKLKALDLRRAKTIEKENPRRLIRAIEIALSTKKPIPRLKKHSRFSPILFLGIKKSFPELKKSIQKRVQERIKRGWVKEVKRLLLLVSQKRMRELGLGYQWIPPYLKKEISKEEMMSRILKSEMDFARRQMAWFKKDPRIHWIKHPSQAHALILDRIRK